MAVKTLNLSDWPKEAWRIIQGGNSVNPGMKTVTEVYDLVPAVMRGVDMRADTVSAIDLELSRRNGDPIDRPETIIPWWGDVTELVAIMELDRTLFGAAYLLKEGSTRRLDGLRRLHPSTVTPIYDEWVGLTGFIRALNGQQLRLSTEEVVYSWRRNAKAEVGPGTSPVKAALSAAGVLMSIDDFQTSYFANGTINALLISPDSSGNMMPPQAEQERFKDWVSRLGQRAFSALATTMMLKVQEIGHKMTDALPDGIVDQRRVDIATALGFPSTLLFSSDAGGLGGGGVREQDTIDFYNSTIFPECRKIAAALNDQVFHPMGYELRFKEESVEVMQAQEAQKAERLSSLYTVGILTLDEVRAQLGYDPLPTPEPASPPPALPDPSVVEGESENLDDEVMDELKTWERFYLKRVAKGGRREFRTEVIPDRLKAAVEGMLESAGDNEHLIRAAFRDAYQWRLY